MFRSGFLLAIFLTLFAFFPATSQAEGCLVCHSAMKGKIESSAGVLVNVHVEAEKYTDSLHGGLDCTSCHMKHAVAAHAEPDAAVPEMVSELLGATELKAKTDPVALAACVLCHPDTYEALKGSVHGQKLFSPKTPEVAGRADGPLCLDCHGNPHYITRSINRTSPVNHGNLLYTCGNCHEDEGIIKRHGLGAHVIEKYKESFHGKKYMLGHTGVPICSTCHGSHNIMKWDAPGSPAIGAGKVKTCGKCHKGATKKFAAAPAHKHIGKDNPIPYYGEKLLILLVFATFLFVISHVILEALSEMREKMFSKKKGGGQDD